jgi:DNA-binding winged helix-turn-helix (wHTH) protein
LRYLFEEYVLDVDRHELRKGDAVLSVEPQVFDLLTLLVRHRERIVSRDELLAHVWEGRSISDSTFTSRINTARGAIGDSGEDQRLIRTVPRRGYRFVGTVREQPNSPEGSARETSAIVPAETRGGVAIAETTAIGLEQIARRHLPVRNSVPFLMLSAFAASGAIAAVVWFVLSLATKTLPSMNASFAKFDASVVPLVTDEVRRTLAGYPGRPDAKALAISNEGWSVADSAPDIESAKQEALRQCTARAKGVCRIYAAGMDVVLSRDTLPLPAPGDIRLIPLQEPLIVDEIPTLNSTARHEIEAGHMKGANHKALAITTRGYFWVNNLPTRGEPARLAVERCTELTQRPCLLLAVDGFLTMKIPKSRPIVRIFLPSTEADISMADRERISRTYQGDEWRALARGKTGTWHPFAGASSETAAIEGALRLCSQAEDDCRLYAIGNFRIADE